MTQGNFMSWAGMCVKCGKIRKVGHGLFCSNFLLGATHSPRAGMSGVGSVIGKQAMIASHDWTTTEKG
jgi:hypothetical protein